MKPLRLERPLDNDYKVIKDNDGNNTAIELKDDNVRLTNLEVTGTLTGTPVADLATKQDSLTFGLSSGNALKSEEALTTNDILLAGS